MGERYNRVHDQDIRQKSIFLPMLCAKPSIKDVKLPKCNRDRSESFSGDPLSPRIGCMGQVKRNNRVSGVPIAQKLALTAKNAIFNNSSSNVNVGYLKLRKFFSSKNLIASPSSAASVTVAVDHVRRSRRMATRNCGNGAKEIVKSEKFSSLSIVDLDPPLPVIKRVQKDGGGEMDNLWKRRSGGIVLQSLQIQQTHLTRHSLQIATV